MSVFAPEKTTNLYDHIDISYEEAQEMERRALASVFADVVEDPRAPESEIYGRSLSTPRRLGHCAIRKVASEVANSPEAEQAKAEFYTSVEEGFGTDIELGGGLEVRDFDIRPVINGEVMSKDPKRSVVSMTTSGLECAEEKFKREKSQGDHRFRSQLIRSYWDNDNAIKTDMMARGETDYNTRIVVSPYPEEAHMQTGGAYWGGIGYVPHLRRGFVQLYFAGSEEGFVAGSLSFSGSDKQRLKEIFYRHGVDIPESETTDNWLQYAITDTLTKEQAKALALDIANEADDPSYKKTAGEITNTVDVTRKHRLIMDEVFNGSYVHACESLARGHQTPETRKLIFQLANNAKHFNDRYKEALYEMRADESKFTDDDMIVIHELLVYSAIEMMRALHLEKNTQAFREAGAHQNQESDLAYIQTIINSGSFQEALSNFGAVGAMSHRTYFACGLSISLGGEDDPNDSPQSAFGGLDKNKEKCTFISKTCPKCGAKNVLTTVTATQISGSCGCRASKK